MGLRRYLSPENWYSNKIVLLLKRPAEEPFVQEALKPGHTVQRVTAKNVTDTRRFESMSYAAIYNKMLEHGDYGAFGYIDGKCAARLWGMVRPNEREYYGLSSPMERDAIYVHYVETAPDCRRQGIMHEALGMLIAWSRGRNMYVTIDLENIPSLRLHKQWGFSEIAIIRVRRRWMKIGACVHWLG